VLRRVREDTAFGLALKEIVRRLQPSGWERTLRNSAICAGE